MKYLCLGYHDEQAWAAMPRQERDALLEETFAYQELLREGGHYLRGDALQSAQNAATLRFKSGEVLLTDGPFAETKELIAGYWIIQVKNKAEAIEWMKRCPNPHEEDCEIEIRQFFELEDFGESPAVEHHRALGTEMAQKK